MRPKLHPHVAISWRNATTLQIGLSPDPAVLIQNATSRTLSNINSMDGVRTLDEIRARFEKDHSIESPHEPKFEEVLQALNAVHALVDADGQEGDPYLHKEFRERLLWQTNTQDLLRPTPDSGFLETQARKNAYVAVNGADPLALATAHLLALIGVGRVVIDTPDHLRYKLMPQTYVGLGPSWSRIGEPVILATREMLTELNCKVTRPRGLAEPNFEIFSSWPQKSERDRVHAHSTPYLMLESAGVSANIGPLVLPGQSPCARCVEISNSRNDPYWPGIVTQVSSKPNGATDGLVDPAVIAWAASMAVMSVSAALSGEGRLASSNPLIGQRLLLRCPGPNMRQVTFDLEPDCGCTG